MGRPSEFFCRTPCSKITAAAHRPYTLANTHCYTFVSQSHVMVANVDITFPCHCKFSFGMKTRARVRRRPLLSKSIQLPCTVKLLKHSSVYSILAQNTPKVIGRHPPRDRGPSLRACVGPRCQACRAMTGGRRLSGRYHLDLRRFRASRNASSSLAFCAASLACCAASFFCCFSTSLLFFSMAFRMLGGSFVYSM
jgi:hypothetical protein